MPPRWSLASALALASALGPSAVRAVRQIAPLVAANPDAVRTGRELLEKALAARSGRTPEERLRRTTAALHEQAVREQAAAGSPEEAERAAGWVRQADSLASALALVELRRGADRRRDLARLQRRTDVLFAEVFTAAVRDDG